MLCAAVTLYDIGDQSLWLDEGYSFSFAATPWSNFWALVTTSQANMGLYYVLLRGWVELGTSEAFVRALSAVFTVATIPVVYAIGRRLFGGLAGLLAALLRAVNSFAVQYGQEVRGYSLVAFLVAAATLLLIRATERPSVGRWTAYAVVGALSCYVHFFAALVLAVHVVSLLLLGTRNLSIKPAAAAIGLIGVLVAPLMLFLITRDSNPIGWIDEPTTEELGRALEELSGGVGPWLPLSYGVLLVVVLVEAVRAWPAGSSVRWGHALVLGWVLFPIAASYAVSFLSPMFVPRYLIVSLPALAIMGGLGLARLRPLPATAIALMAIVVMSAFGLRDWYADESKDGWRGATRHIVDNAREGDGIIVYPPKVRAPFEYYFVERFNGGDEELDPIYPRAAWGNYPRHAPRGPDFARRLADSARNHERVWVVFSRTNRQRRRATIEQLAAQSESMDNEKFRRVVVLLFDTAGPGR